MSVPTGVLYHSPDDGVTWLPILPGIPGPPGLGVPAGGITGQALVKKSNTDNDTEWSSLSGGGGISQADADARYVNISGDVMEGPLSTKAQPIRVLMGASNNKGSELWVWGEGLLLKTVNTDGSFSATSVQYDPPNNTTKIGTDWANETEQKVRIIGSSVQLVRKDGDPFIATWPDHAVSRQAMIDEFSWHASLPDPHPQYLKRVITTVNSNITAGSDPNTDYVYKCTGPGITITLPTAIGNKNRYTVKSASVGTFTIATVLGQLIDDASTFVLDIQYVSIDLVSDGANWMVI